MRHARSTDGRCAYNNAELHFCLLSSCFLGRHAATKPRKSRHNKGILVILNKRIGKFFGIFCIYLLPAIVRLKYHPLMHGCDTMHTLLFIARRVHSAISPPLATVRRLRGTIFGTGMSAFAFYYALHDIAPLKRDASVLSTLE